MCLTRTSRYHSTRRSWLVPLLPREVEEWFQEGHGIISGYKDSHGVWIPRHAKNGRVYFRAPPPIIADVALKECLKEVQKRTDANHIFLIPCLFAPAWLCMFYKLANVIFTIPVGSPLLPFNMHEPLFVGIALPFIRCRPWSLQGMPLLVELAGRLQEMFKSSPRNGGVVLFLRTPSQLASMLNVLARQVSRVYGDRNIPHEDAPGRAGESVVQAEAEGG